MGPVKVLGRAVQKVADSVMMTLIDNDAMYIYNVSWVSCPPCCSRAPIRKHPPPRLQRQCIMWNRGFS